MDALCLQNSMFAACQLVRISNAMEYLGADFQPLISHQKAKSGCTRQPLLPLTPCVYMTSKGAGDGTRTHDVQLGKLNENKWVGA